MSEDKNRVYILELSSFQLENIVSFKPFISILLNITPDHQDRYGNMEKYLNAKMKISMNQDKKCHLLYNSDDKVLVENCKNLNVRKTTFGLESNGQNIIKSDGFNIYIDQKKLISTDTIILKGRHNLSNILAAATAAKIGMKCRLVQEKWVPQNEFWVAFPLLSIFLLIWLIFDVNYHIYVCFSFLQINSQSHQVQFFLMFLMK